MPQMTIRRPFRKLDLRHQLRFKPHTVLHLFLGQSPLGAFLLWQIGKRAAVCLQTLEPGCDFTAKLRHKAVSHLGGIEQALALVITNDQGIKRIAWRVTADNKPLSTVNLILDPGTASVARLIERVLPLGDNALETELHSDSDQLFRVCG